MADVKTKFIGESDQAIKEIEKLERAMVKLRESNLKLAQTTKETAHESHSAFREQIDEYGKMLTGLVTIEKTVDFVKESYAEWREEIQELGKEAEKSSAALVHLLSKTGDLAKGHEVEEFIKKSGVAPDTMQAALEGVSGAAPGVRLDRRLELAQVAGESNVLHGDPKGTGELIGQIAKINPKLSAEDALDVATLLRQKAGNRAEELSGHNSIETALQLVESGAANADEAFGLLATALQNEGSTKMLDKVASSVKNPGAKIKPKRGKPLTDEQIAHNAFVDASPKERLELLLRDQATQEAVLGNVGAARFSRLSPEDIAKAAAEVGTAMKSDLAKQNVKQLEGFQAGREHKANVAVETQTKLTDEELAEKVDAQARVRAEKRLDTLIKQLQNEGKIGPVGAAKFRTQFRIGRALADYFPDTYGPGGSEVGRGRVSTIGGASSKLYAELLEYEKRAAEGAERPPRANVKPKNRIFGIDPAWMFGENLPHMEPEQPTVKQSGSREEPVEGGRPQFRPPVEDRAAAQPQSAPIVNIAPRIVDSHRALVERTDQRLMGPRREPASASNGATASPPGPAADVESRRLLNEVAENSKRQVDLQKEANDIARTRPPFVPSPYTHREW